MRLICFGDSWTAGHGIENNTEYKEIVNTDYEINKEGNVRNKITKEPKPISIVKGKHKVLCLKRKTPFFLSFF